MKTENNSRFITLVTLEDTTRTYELEWFTDVYNFLVEPTGLFSIYFRLEINDLTLIIRLKTREIFQD